LPRRRRREPVTRACRGRIAVTKLLMEPVKGMSEKEKRVAIEQGHRLQRMVAKLLHEEHASHAQGVAVCLNLAIVTSFSVGLTREQVLEMAGRGYDEVAGKSSRG
jgi:hypothetical protein